MKESEKIKALNVVNKIRALHKLQPVTYNSYDDNLVAKSALITAASSSLSHHPTSDYACYTAEGALGSSKSNLHLNWYYGYPNSVKSVDFALMRFLVDNHVESLGHRRWMLDPFLKEISYGRVDGKPKVENAYGFATGVSLKVVNDDVANISNTSVEYVAYPYEEYPSYYFEHDWYSSFSVLVDKTNRWNNSNVDFSNVKITVTDESGKVLNVSNISSNTENYGLSNILQWKSIGTTNGIKYFVKIKNVLVQGVERNYDYWFEIN